MAEGLVAMSDIFAPMREAAVGYRAQMMEVGFPEDAAASMAADFHRSAMQLITANLLKGIAT